MSNAVESQGSELLLAGAASFICFYGEFRYNDIGWRFDAKSLRWVRAMKKIIIAPDSFKGTMSADTVCAVIEAALRRHMPEVQIVCLPLADGGEGMTAAYIRLLGGREIRAVVSDPQEEPVEAVYGVLNDGGAVMEMAACAGLTLVRGKPDPMRASTRGVGELLLDAQARGLHRVLLGIGGSATNDCGLGMAAALGYRFYDAGGAVLDPHAYNMGRIAHIEKPAVLPELEIVAACDVTNPLCGQNGATYVFSGQKGLAACRFAEVDAAMARFADVIQRDLGVAVRDMAGAGAAGGLGAALAAFLGARLVPGIDLLLDAIGFDARLADCDLVITGEGRIDGQSVAGKVPVGVALRAKRCGVPCLALCGSVGPRAELVYDCGMTAVYSAVRAVTTFEEVRRTSLADLDFLADSVARTLVMRARGRDGEAEGGPAGIPGP